MMQARVTRCRQVLAFKIGYYTEAKCAKYTHHLAWWGRVGSQAGEWVCFEKKQQ